MAKISLNDLQIESQILPINGLKVDFTKDPKACKSNAERARNTWIIVPDGRKFQVSSRFWVSFASLFNLGINLFAYFSYDEVFARLTEKKGKSVRITMEGSNGTMETGMMLSCTDPSKPLLKVEEVRTLVHLHDGVNAMYEAGIVQASFKAPYPQEFSIGNSTFTTRFMVQLPVDGYGLPNAYLELQRGATQAVITGATKAFKTMFQLGKDDTSLTTVLDRVMTTFNNEEGYHTFKIRLEAATKSWASFYEAGQLHDLIEAVLEADQFELDQKSGILKQFNNVVGNPLSYYGVTGSNELSQRKAKTIPVQATVFDLFNFVTEVNTHYVTTRAGRQRLNEWIGMKIAEEYDLEGTCDTNPEFKDFFLAGTKAAIEAEAVTAGGGRALFFGEDDGPVTGEQAPLPSGIIQDGETVFSTDTAPPLPGAAFPAIVDAGPPDAPAWSPDAVPVAGDATDSPPDAPAETPATEQANEEANHNLTTVEAAALDSYVDEEAEPVDVP